MLSLICGGKDSRLQSHIKGKEITAQTHLYDLRFDLELGRSLTLVLIVYSPGWTLEE